MRDHHCHLFFVKEELIPQIDHQLSYMCRRHIEKKLDKEKLCFINEALADNDELIAGQLLIMLQEKWPDLSVSLSTIKRVRKDDLGWVMPKL